jgi:FeS assembly SUF system regulator
MMRLGKLTDYAIALMVQMMGEGAGFAASASSLADKVGVPEPTVAKVLKKLARAGLLQSVRGAAGGYRLNVDPAHLSVCAVIEAIDGPIAVVSCVGKTDHACKAEMRCPAKERWQPINAAVRHALGNVRLADLAAKGHVHARHA